MPFQAKKVSSHRENNINNFQPIICLIIFKQDQWQFELYIDGVIVEVLDGIPVLSEDTQLILHIWNADNFVPDIPDNFHPPTSTAYFRDLR